MPEQRAAIVYCIDARKTPSLILHITYHVSVAVARYFARLTSQHSLTHYMILGFVYVTQDMMCS